MSIQFDPSLVSFLSQLKRNNNRTWFGPNKLRYEAQVRQPVLAFIRQIAPLIERLSPHIFVSDLRVGGSMMRPYRDTRFSSSKEPYKTNVGVHFRHERGEDAHAPGLWLHIEPGEFWLAAGLWRPDAATANLIRRRIADLPQEWLAARDNRRFRSLWEIQGDSLKRPPRGFDPADPLIEDIKRVDFLGVRDMGARELYRPDIVQHVARCYAATKPFMKFLCDAVGVRF